MKKFLGAIISGAAGVLSLVFLCLPAFTIDGVIADATATGWELLTQNKWADLKLTAVTWYRIFAWILVVLAVILIVMALLQLLSSLGIVKMPAILVKVTNFALIALVVVSILALIANFGVRWECIEPAKDAGLKGKALKAVKDTYIVGASLWVVSIVNIIAAVCANLFAKNKK